MATTTTAPMDLMFARIHSMPAIITGAASVAEPCDRRAGGAGRDRGC